MYKKIIILLVISILFIAVGNSTLAEENEKFSDVPANDWAEEAIYALKELGVSNGRGDGTFGYNENITRAEFLTFLIRVLGVELEEPSVEGSFNDIQENDWYAPYIYAGLTKEIIIDKEYPEGIFNPNQYINREEMALMIIRALGYDSLAMLLNTESNPFSDVEQNKGYITLAKDFGIINGKTDETFAPTQNALRQEAAVMLIRMYKLLHQELNTKNGIYAISSYSQLDKMKYFDTISMGWSRIEYDQEKNQVKVTTELPAPNHPFYIPPDGFVEVLDEADENNIEKYIMVFATNEDKIINSDGEEVGILSHMLDDEKSTSDVIKEINRLIDQTTVTNTKLKFDGVVIDFEALRDEGENKEKFISFLSMLKNEIDKKNKKLIVCVHPKRQTGQVYYDGYDYKAIGEIADKVILMAHDYAPKKLTDEEKENFTPDTPTPLAPIKDIYYALKYATDAQNGIPRDKLLLQISFGTLQWNFEEGKIVNTFPYTPYYEVIKEKMTDTAINDFRIAYSDAMQSPSVIYTDPKTGLVKRIWYEDERSVEAKIILAKIFGIEGISIWRLGTVPDYKESELQEKINFLDLWPIINNEK